MPIVCDGVNLRCFHLISASSVHTRSRRHVAQLAFLFGLITFVANYIPNVGAIVATLLPLPFVLLDPSVSTAVRYARCRHAARDTRAPRRHPAAVHARLLAFILPLSAHMLVGNVIEPKVFGSRMELHPIVVLLSLAFWGSLWGARADMTYTCISRESSSSSHLHLPRRLRRDPLRPSHRRASHCAERLARSAQHGAPRDATRRRAEPVPRRPRARSITGRRLRCEAPRNRKLRRALAGTSKRSMN